MKIGRLRHRIDIQSKAIDDGFGTAPLWATDSQVYCQISELNGRELETNKQINELISVKIIVRYNTSITSKNRLKFGTRIFDIISVINDERKTMTTIMTSEQ